MVESKKPDELPEMTPDNYPLLPDQIDEKRGGRWGFGIFLAAIVFIGGFGLVVVSMPPAGGTTRSAKLETQRREQLIEQALRDAQAAGQFADEPTELAAGD